MAKKTKVFKQMALTSSLVAQVITEVDDGHETGTAYPIRQNIILTAWHVIPNIKNYRAYA